MDLQLYRALSHLRDRISPYGAVIPLGHGWALPALVLIYTRAFAITLEPEGGVKVRRSVPSRGTRPSSPRLRKIGESALRVLVVAYVFPLALLNAAAPKTPNERQKGPGLVTL